MLFDKDLLQEIKRRADIVDVLSSFLNVIKKGKNYVALCPFHDDHNPSLQISKDKQTYHCFVCGNAGDVFTFVENYEKVSFAEAVRRVADLVNFDDPRLHQRQYVEQISPEISVLYKCINDLTNYYRYGLDTEEGLPARAYLEKRGITPEQIREYSLGYAPKDGRKTVTYLLQKGYSLKNIEDIGITLATEGASDNNAGRLIFPLKDARGQIVGFSARKLTAEGSDPKYVNSPETKIFRKGSTIYNFDQARQSSRHDGYVYVLEGFMDVYALEAVGEKSAVAIMGTALTSEQIGLLRRLNCEIRLCLDGDDPGQRAMMKIMPLFDGAGLSYRLVHVPKEIRDPDDILREDGKDKLKAFLKSLVDPFPFALSFYENVSPLGSQEERTRLIDRFVPLLTAAKARSNLEYEDYLAKLAKVTRYDKDALKDYVNEEARKIEEGTPEPETSFREETRLLAPRGLQRDLRRLDSAERAVLAQMLNSREAYDYYEKNIRYFYDEIYRLIANYEADYLAKYDDLDVSLLIDAVKMSKNEKKDEIVKEIVVVSQEGEKTRYSEKVMDDYKAVIEETRSRLYQKDLVKKAFEGKSVREKARIADDYLKKTHRD